jgi:hypothetical protein
MEIFLIFVAIGAVVAIGIYVAFFMERKRSLRMKEVATELGLVFDPKANNRLILEMADFALFSQGHDRKFTNVMEGETGSMELRIFDYRYTQGGGQHQHVTNQTVLCFRSHELALPHFSLRPETVWHKIGSLFGYQDINFDSHPGFSRRYLLRGKDEPGIRNLFSDDVLTFYENHAGLCTEGDGDRLIYYRSGKRIKPEDIRSFLQEGCEVYGLLKDESPEESIPPAANA